MNLKGKLTASMLPCAVVVGVVVVWYLLVRDGMLMVVRNWKECPGGCFSWQLLKNAAWKPKQAGIASNGAM